MKDLQMYTMVEPSERTKAAYKTRRQEDGHLGNILPCDASAKRRGVVKPHVLADHQERPITIRR